MSDATSGSMASERAGDVEIGDDVEGRVRTSATT